MNNLEMKQADMRKEQKSKNKQMTHRRATAQKLQQIINTATDQTTIIEAANALAKFLPKPKSPRRRRGTPVGKSPIKAKELTVENLVAAMDKKRRGQALTEDEKQMVAAMEERQEVATQKSCC